MRHLPVLFLLPMVGCLTYEGFLQKHHERYCEELAICSPASDCPLPEVTDTGYSADVETCDFDAGLARECLNGVWECYDAFPGFEYPIGPQACEAVCGIAGPQ